MSDHAEVPLVSSADEDSPEPGIAVCFSGGGYRAMLFHLGVSWYLHDAGILGRVARISSVSGGSITAGVLGRYWNALNPSNFATTIVAPVRKLASTTIDVSSVLRGLFWRGSVSDKIIDRYRDLLFGDTTLQDLPDSPRFVINATNVQTGSVFRFSKPYIGDWQVGRYLKPTTLLAQAVAASSAFPPVLSPVTLRFQPGDFSVDPGSCHREPFTTKVILTDGGVYDNMGIETAWKRYQTILVSDAGGKMQPEAEPHADWARHALRVNSLIDNQVRSLRKRQIVASFKNKHRTGAYWGMWTNPDDYPVASALPIPRDHASELAHVATRLKELGDDMQERLINFGFAMAERAIRSYYDPAALRPTAFPYSRGV